MQNLNRVTLGREQGFTMREKHTRVSVIWECSSSWVGVETSVFILLPSQYTHTHTHTHILLFESDVNLEKGESLILIISSI